MSRVHCLDCGTDVPVDPLGHCPDGHLLPAAGRMVESAIGSDDHHPDEPEPWVGQVAAEAEEETDAVTPTAQPQAAPGLAPAEREADAGDLLRELGALGTDDEPDPPAPGAGPQPTASQPAPADPPAAPPASEGRAPEGGGAQAPSSGPDPAVSELSALEQAVQSLDASHDSPSATEAQPAPAPPASEPAPPASEAPAAPAPVDESLSSLFDDLEGLGDHTPAGDGSGSPAPPPPPSAPSTPPPAAPTAQEPDAPDSGSAPRPRRSRRNEDPGQRQLDASSDIATLASEATEPGPDAGAGAHDGDRDGEREAPAPTRGGDTMNFTAKGGDMNGRRRRRRFGR